MPQQEQKRPILSAEHAHERAIELPIADVVVALIDLLGAPVVAIIGGVGETRAVQQWTTGRKPQRPNVLRFALQIAMMIASNSDREMARAWFEGSNPHLDDAIPALMLRNQPLAHVQQRMMGAARAFASRPLQ